MKSKIIVALDVSSLGDIRFYARMFAGQVAALKIGLEAYYALGNDAIEAAREFGCKIFLDLKLHDIPNTIRGAMRSIREKASMVTIHASAGVEAMRAAVENRGETDVIAVTVLTSISDEKCRELYGVGREDKVLSLVADATVAGVQGIVCSGQELGVLSDMKGIKKIVPGIRPIWAELDDQKIIVLPSEAVRNGADYLVIGRPILKPPPHMGLPLAALGAIKEEIGEKY